MPRLEAWHPRMDENPPSPPFSKGGLGGFQGYFLTKPESRVAGENRDPVFEMAPSFRRDDVWTPVSTGVTTFYDPIRIGIPKWGTHFFASEG